MKVLIADFLFVDAHKEMNMNFIGAISKFAQADVVSLNGYYDDQKKTFNENNVNFIDVDIKRKSGPIGTRYFSLELMKITGDILKKNNYEAILCLGFETFIFELGLSCFRSTPLIVFHHKNIDELTNVLKRTVFACYKDKIYHVVFEEFFQERLVNEVGVSADRVFVVPHPVKPTKNVQTVKKYDCIGLCNSNDESFIRDAIDKKVEFQKKGLHILLRSKNEEIRQGAVEVIKGFLDKEKYDELMSAGRTVFVPLPDNYIYRLSGSIYDALSRGKIVITTSNYYAQEYDRRYPGTCEYINTVDQLIECLLVQRVEDSSLSFQKFLDDHSIDYVAQKIERMLEIVLK